MSLVHKFEANKGDLVVFSSLRKPDKVGYVVKYCPSTIVTLSNMGLSLSKDTYNNRWDPPSWAFPGEKISSVRLEDWDSYKILRKYNID